MIILIEGIDGAGKTTLAKRLERQTGWYYMGRSHKTDGKTDLYEFYKSLIKNHKSLILDRCWYSEMVYGPIFREHSKIDFYQMYELERLLEKGNALLIHCVGKEQTLWDRCQRRGEDFVTNRQAYHAIYKGFNKLMAIPHLIPVLNYECP